MGLILLYIVMGVFIGLGYHNSHVDRGFSDVEHEKHLSKVWMVGIFWPAYVFGSLIFALVRLISEDF